MIYTGHVSSRIEEGTGSIACMVVEDLTKITVKFPLE